MKRSEAVGVIQEAVYLMFKDYIASDEECSLALDFLLSKGFPIPCNKRGKFEWDLEVKLEVQDETK